MRVLEPPHRDLLTRAERAGLPFGVLVRLYFDPFPLFRDARVGDLFRREASLRYNRTIAPVLIVYLARWAMLLAAFAACCVACEAAIPVHRAFVVLTMFCGVGFATSVAALCVLAAGYVLLTRAPQPQKHR